MPVKDRPLSPHLQVYRLPLAALTSISHRLSGLALSGGMFVLTLWLVLAAIHPECFANLAALIASPVGRVLCALWLLAFYYHLCAGIRHLIWDKGIGFEKPAYRISNFVVIGSALALTALTLFLACGSVP